MLNALSFDVEEWYHAELVRHKLSPDTHTSQVEQATWPILDLLARHGVHATFFVVGEVLRDHPSLVRAIVEGGHEIGCHGMSHRPLWEMTPETFRTELREWLAWWRMTASSHSTDAPAPLGFRAPTFSLHQKTRWALAILAEEGFTYDSSIFPVANYLYGLSGGPICLYRPSNADLRLHDPNGPLVELPMTVWEVAGRRLPVSGGAYLRILPLPLLAHAFRQITTTRPVVLYMHPWEMYDKTPVVPGLTITERLITYYNRSSALLKLERILDEFAFGRVCDVLPIADDSQPSGSRRTGRTL